MTILVLIVMILGNILRDVPSEDIFKLSASTTASKFWAGFQVGTDV